MTSHTVTKIYTELRKLIPDEKSPFCKNVDTVYDEDDQFGCYLATFQKSKVEDDRPSHIGVSILQWSKYLFVDFMYFLERHLVDGSFKTVYADTDSMAMALTRTKINNDSLKDRLKGMFEPIVKPSMRSSWDENWEKWLVTTKETKDIRRPGKLKGFCNFCVILC